MAPSSIMLCRTPRETCGSCSLRKTSRRSRGSDCSTVIESVLLSMGRRRNRGGDAPALRTLRKPKPKPGADRDDENAGGLAGSERTDFLGVIIAAEIFRERAQDCVAD